MRGIIQVAGIKCAAEAEMLLGEGVDWLGFPLRLEFHDEDLPAGAVADIISRLRIADRAVLITYLNDAGAAAELVRMTGCRRIQLHGDIAVGEIASLRRLLPDLEIIKSVVIGDESGDELIARVRPFAPHVHFLITDTLDPVTGARGATGKTHDWALSRRIVEESRMPVILAGGLTPGNVGRAILQVRPAGVDAHTGVERDDGMKDPLRVREFVRESRKAFAELEARVD